MTKLNEKPEISLKKTVEIVVSLAAIIGLFIWCFRIIAPFFNLIVWGIIIAVALYPGFKKLERTFGDRKKLAALVITLVLLGVIILPSIKLTGSLVTELRDFSQDIINEDVQIAPPPDKVADWPLIGEWAYKTWQSASEGLVTILQQFEPQLIKISKWLLETVVETGFGLIKFMLSIIIAGILLINSGNAGRVARNVFIRVAGDRGKEFADLSEKTIRNVTRGILGVAIIQSLLAGLGFILAGIPGAGLWTFLALLFAVIQVGVAPVTIPVIVYMFYTMNTPVAILFTIYFLVVMISDNILKPLLLGKGAPVPMLVVFLGAIGGFITTGFLGLFTGAVILSLGYKLFQVWIGDKDMKPAME